MAFNVTLGHLKVVLTATSDEFVRDLTKSAREYRKTARAFEDIGGVMTKAITLPLIGAGAAVLKFGTDFEDGFAGVRKTVDATEKQFQELEKGFRDLAKVIPVSTDELLRIGEAAGQLGIQTDNIIEFTEVISKIGVATNLTAEEAAVAFAQIANVTQLAQDQFDEMGAALVDLGNNFATDERKIIEFGQRIAAAGKIAGLSVDEILALGTAFASAGNEAEAGGTAIQKVLISLADAAATGGHKLEMFAAVAGQSGEQFRKAFQEDASAAITSFIEGLKRVSDEGGNVFQVLDALELKDQRLIRALLSTANAGDLVRNAFTLGNEAFRENTALNEEAARRFETTKSQLILLGNALKDIAVELFDSLRPILVNDIIPALRTMADSLGVVARWFGSLPGPVKTATIALLGVFAVGGPILIGMGAMLSAAATLKGAFASLTTVIAGSGGLTLSLSALLPILAAVAAGFAAIQVGSLIADLWELRGVSAQVREEKMALINQTQRLADTLKKAGIEAYRRTGESTEEYRQRLLALLREHGKQIEATTKVESVQGRAAKSTDFLAELTRTLEGAQKKASSSSETLATKIHYLTSEVDKYTAQGYHAIDMSSELARVLEQIDPPVDRIRAVKDELDEWAKNQETFNKLIMPEFQTELSKTGWEIDVVKDKTKDLTREQKRNAEFAEDWRRAWSTAIGNTISKFTGALGDMIFKGQKFSLDLKDIFTNLAQSLFEIMLTRLFSPLFKLFDSFIGSLFGGLFGGGGGGGGTLSQAGGGGGLLGAGLFGKIGGGLSSLGGLLAKGAGAFFSNPFGLLAAGGIGAFFGLRALLSKSPYSEGSGEIARDFGIKVPKNIVEQFAKGLGLGKDFDRKSLFSSPLFLQNVLGPAAQASGQTQQLIAAFGKLEAFGKTFDFSAAVTEALNGNFEAFNKQFQQVFGPALGTLTNQLLGTSSATQQNTEALDSTTSSFSDTGEGIQDSQGLLTNAVRELRNSISELSLKLAELTTRLASMPVGTPTVSANPSLEVVESTGFTAGSYVVNFQVQSDSENLVATTKTKVIPLIMDVLTTGQGGHRAKLAQIVATTANG